MREPKRARRIRDKQRMKAKCRRVYPRDTEARLADHLANCSCRGCGNPRRWDGERTMQERKFFAAQIGVFL